MGPYVYICIVLKTSLVDTEYTDTDTVHFTVDHFTAVHLSAIQYSSVQCNIGDKWPIGDFELGIGVSRIGDWGLKSPIPNRELTDKMSNWG